MSTARRAAIRAFVYELILENSNFNREDLVINGASPLTEEELGVDSLNMIEVLMKLEGKYNITIKDDAFTSFTTIDDLIDFLDDAIDLNYRFDEAPQLHLLVRA